MDPTMTAAERAVLVGRIHRALGDTVPRGAIESVLRQGEALGVLRLVAEGSEAPTSDRA